MNNALIGNYRDKLKELRALVDSADGQPLSDPQFSKYCRIEDEVDSLAHRISTDQGALFGPQIPADAARSERLAAREAWLDQYARRHQYDHAPGFGLEDTSGDGSRGGSSGGFRSLGEQLQAVIRAGTPGQAPDPRLYQVRAASGMNELVGAEGGFLVGSDFSTSLLERAIEAATIAPRCNSFPIGANANEIKLPRTDETSRANGSRFGGVQLYWSTGEGSDFTPSKPKLGQLLLKPGKLTGLCYLTDELVQDASVLENYVRQCFTSEYAYVIDDAILTADGAGKPLGILNSAGVVTVAKESSQAASTIVAENIWKMFARMLPSSLGRAIWLVNQSCWPQLFQMSLKVKNVAGTENVGGAPIFLPGGSVAGAPFGTLLGRPIFPMEQCKALGTKGDVLFGDFGRYVLSTKGNLRTDTSVHVRFIQDESVIRFALRIDGQPELNSTVTPANGTDALSPFVVLADRA